MLRFKIVTHVHGGRWLTIPPHGAGRVGAAFFFMLLRLSHIVLALGVQQKATLIRYGADRSRTSILDSVFETEAVACEKQPRSILYLGRLERQKGVLLLPEVMSRLRLTGSDYILHVAGTGPDALKLRSHLEQSGVNYVWHDVVVGRAKQELLAAAHIFLLPSLFEGLPLALLEAVSHGCIPVTSAVGEMPAIVAAVGGQVVSSFDPRDYAEAICRAAKAARLPPESVEAALKPYSVPKVLRKLDLMYGVL